MKKFRQIAAFIVCIMLVASCLTACGVSKTGEEETGTVHFDSAQDAYNAMTDAVQKGEYNAALTYYNSGAAGADADDAIYWYYYAMASADHEKNGCIGFPLDLLQNKVDSGFEESKALLGELQKESRDFYGVYSGSNGCYLYIQEGKILADVDVQLTDKVICNGELALQDGVYYWVEHNVNGDDKIMYTIKSIENGIAVETASEKGSTDTIYAGNYYYTVAEMPVLYY